MGFDNNISRADESLLPSFDQSLSYMGFDNNISRADGFSADK
jgi:hypothetical protein